MHEPHNKPDGEASSSPLIYLNYYVMTRGELATQEIWYSVGLLRVRHFLIHLVSGKTGGIGTSYYSWHGKTVPWLESESNLMIACQLLQRRARRFILVFTLHKIHLICGGHQILIRCSTRLRLTVKNWIMIRIMSPTLIRGCSRISGQLSMRTEYEKAGPHKNSVPASEDGSSISLLVVM